MQENTFDGRWESFSFTEGSIEGTHFITSFNGPNDFRRLQVDNNGNVNMVTDNSNGTWESFLITEAPLTLNRIVHITKRNAPDFAIDGNHGGENEQNIYLWAQDENNINQQWIEIDRGNGYFTYQKMGTNFAIDGDNGGVREQNVYLFTINENNQNQHWQKIPTGGGSFKLVKRNAPEFALNGGNGGINEQNINLFDSSSTSRNLQWFITPVGELSNEVINSFSTEETITLDTTSINSFSTAIIYPNPVITTATISGAENTTIDVYNINGAKLLTQNVTSENQEIDFSSFSSGIYIVKINNSENTSLIKLVKL